MSEHVMRYSLTSMIYDWVNTRFQDMNANDRCETDSKMAAKELSRRSSTEDEKLKDANG